MDDLKVLFLAAEATPFMKVGGLADVAGSLPKALRGLGVDVRVIIPRYGTMQAAGYSFQRVGSLAVPIGPGEEHALLLETNVDGVPIYLIWNDQYFSNRERVYGFNDDPQRFTFFSKGVIATLKLLDWKPDVIHANDWHTAAVPAWLDVYGRSQPHYCDIATLFTIHNLAYQGICGRLILTFAQMEKLPHLPGEVPGQVNWMAQGIAHADLISTVSPTYAREIVSGETGLGLTALLKQRQDRLFGILSGIDTDVWNPATDAALAQTYDAKTLKMRAVNKNALQRETRLSPNQDTPLLSMVTRLDKTKGLELVIPALETLLQERDIQFVLLGTGDEIYETNFRDLQARYPNNVRAFIKFDDRLARRIYGSADILLMPSRDEPSSIALMSAMHYGVVPVVHATGGLADIVVDADAQPDRGTGFAFEDFTAEALLDGIRRALNGYANKTRWAGLQYRAMERDFSWDASARAYVDLYRRALMLHRAS
ncbi:MAG TPA: glycogen/starch synthase [Anaerolineae bacterium]|nr:glycogen/starch synthase [Anaerolineae bacterium]HQK14640.1 glycogen/starch synthase [Anaerolineae bacterium]